MFEGGREEELSLTNSSFEEGYSRVKAAALAKKRTHPSSSQGPLGAAEAHAAPIIFLDGRTAPPIGLHISEHPSSRKPATFSWSDIVPTTGMNSSSAEDATTSAPESISSGGRPRFLSASTSRSSSLELPRRPLPSPLSSRQSAFYQTPHSYHSSHHQQHDGPASSRPSTLRGLLQGDPNSLSGFTSSFPELHDPSFSAGGLGGTLGAQASSLFYPSQGPRQHHHHEAGSLLSSLPSVRTIQEPAAALRLLPEPVKELSFDPLDEALAESALVRGEEYRRAKNEEYSHESIDWIVKRTPQEEDDRVAQAIHAACARALGARLDRLLRRRCLEGWRRVEVCRARRRRWEGYYARHRTEARLALAMGAWRVLGVEAAQRRRREVVVVVTVSVRRHVRVLGKAFGAWARGTRRASRLASLMGRMCPRWDLVRAVFRAWSRLASAGREAVRRAGRRIGLIREGAARDCFITWGEKVRAARYCRQLARRTREAGMAQVLGAAHVFVAALKAKCQGKKAVDRMRANVMRMAVMGLAAVFVSVLRAMVHGTRVLAKHRGAFEQLKRVRVAGMFFAVLRARCQGKRVVEKQLAKVKRLRCARLAKAFVAVLRLRCFGRKKVLAIRSKIASRARDGTLEVHFGALAVRARQARCVRRATAAVLYLAARRLLFSVMVMWRDGSSKKCRLRKVFAVFTRRSIGLTLKGVFRPWAYHAGRARVFRLKTLRALAWLTSQLRLAPLLEWHGHSVAIRRHRLRASAICRGRVQRRRMVVGLRALYAAVPEGRRVAVLRGRVQGRMALVLLRHGFDAFVGGAMWGTAVREACEVVCARFLKKLAGVMFEGWRLHMDRTLCVLRGLEMTRVSRKAWVLSSVTTSYAADAVMREVFRSEEAVERRAKTSWAVEQWWGVCRRKVAWRRAVGKMWRARRGRRMAAAAEAWRDARHQVKVVRRFVASHLFAGWLREWRGRAWEVRREKTRRERATRAARMLRRDRLVSATAEWKGRVARRMILQRKEALLTASCASKELRRAARLWREHARWSVWARGVLGMMMARQHRGRQGRAWWGLAAYASKRAAIRRISNRRRALVLVRALCFRPITSWRAHTLRVHRLRRAAAAAALCALDSLLRRCLAQLLVHAGRSSALKRLSASRSRRSAKMRMESAFRAWAGVSRAARCTMVGLAYSLRQQFAVGGISLRPWGGVESLGLNATALRVETTRVVHACFVEWGLAVARTRARRKAERTVCRGRATRASVACFSALLDYSHHKTRTWRALRKAGMGSRRRTARRAFDRWNRMSAATQSLSRGAQMSGLAHRLWAFSSVSNWYASSDTLSRAEEEAGERAALRAAVLGWRRASTRAKVGRRATQACSRKRRVRLLSGSLGAMARRARWRSIARRLEGRAGERGARRLVQRWRESAKEAHHLRRIEALLVSKAEWRALGAGMRAMRARAAQVVSLQRAGRRVAVRADRRRRVGGFEAWARWRGVRRSERAHVEVTKGRLLRLCAVAWRQRAAQRTRARAAGVGMALRRVRRLLEWVSRALGWLRMTCEVAVARRRRERAHAERVWHGWVAVTSQDGRAKRLVGRARAGHGRRLAACGLLALWEACRRGRAAMRAGARGTRIAARRGLRMWAEGVARGMWLDAAGQEWRKRAGRRTAMRALEAWDHRAKRGGRCKDACWKMRGRGEKGAKAACLRGWLERARRARAAEAMRGRMAKGRLRGRFKRWTSWASLKGLVAAKGRKAMRRGARALLGRALGAWGDGRRRRWLGRVCGGLERHERRGIVIGAFEAWVRGGRRGRRTERVRGRAERKEARKTFVLAWAAWGRLVALQRWRGRARNAVKSRAQRLRVTSIMSAWARGSKELAWLGRSEGAVRERAAALCTRRALLAWVGGTVVLMQQARVRQRQVLRVEWSCFEEWAAQVGRARRAGALMAAGEKRAGWRWLQGWARVAYGRRAERAGSYKVGAGVSSKVLSTAFEAMAITAWWRKASKKASLRGDVSRARLCTRKWRRLTYEVGWGARMSERARWKSAKRLLMGCIAGWARWVDHRALLRQRDEVVSLMGHSRWLGGT